MAVQWMSRHLQKSLSVECQLRRHDTKVETGRQPLRTPNPTPRDTMLSVPCAIPDVLGSAPDELIERARDPMQACMLWLVLRYAKVRREL